MTEKSEQIYATERTAIGVTQYDTSYIYHIVSVKLMKHSSHEDPQAQSELYDNTGTYTWRTRN